MDTAFCPPTRSSTAFIIMEVTRPEILFRKLGLPQATICFTMDTENLGRQNFSCSLPRAKGYRAMATQAIMPREEARAAAQRAEADRRTAEQARAKMAEDMGMLNASLASAQDAREQAMQDVARLEAELADLKAQPVDVAVETVVDQAAIEKARAEAVAEMQAKLDKAREAAAKARDKQKQAEASVEILKRSMEERERAEKKTALGADKDLAQFEVFFNQAKDHANQMLELLFHARSQKNQDTAQIMEKALMALSEQIGRCAK